MHDEIISLLADISAQLKSAGVRHRTLTDELILLRSENKNLKQSKEELEKKISQMEELIFILKSSVSPLDEESKKEFERRLNKYLLTINKCMGLLKT